MIRSLLLLACVLLAMPSAQAQAPADSFKEGVHYYRLDQPVRTRDPNKIEVVEAFTYSCPHCYRFDPLVKAWLKTLPADVDFQRLPVIWSNTTELHARAYYAAQALGVLDKIHDPIFNALHEQGNPLNSQQRIADLFAKYGVSAGQFDKAFNAFGVGSQVNQAKSRMLSYRIEGTPELVVAGKYRVSSKPFSGAGISETTTQQKMLQAVDYLIEKERRERKK